MIELRHNTEQTIPIGVLIQKKSSYSAPHNPIVGAKLNWYYWCYLRKANGQVYSIMSRAWSDVPNCDGCYNLTLLESDVDFMGTLMIYIFDSYSLQNPIFIITKVVSQNYYDAKYGDLKLAVSVEPFAERG